MHSRPGKGNSPRYQRQAGSFLLVSNPGDEYKVLWCCFFFFKANSLKPYSVGRVSPLSGAITSPDVNEYFQH